MFLFIHFFKNRRRYIEEIGQSEDEIEGQCGKVWFRAPETEISCDRVNISFSEAMFCFYIVDRIKTKENKSKQNKKEPCGFKWFDPSTTFIELERGCTSALGHHTMAASLSNGQGAQRAFITLFGSSLGLKGVLVINLQKLWTTFCTHRLKGY